MLFEVRALTADNTLKTVVVDALDETSARRLISEKSMRALTMRTAKPRRAYKNFSLILFSQELLALLEAGLSIVESLDALSENQSATASKEIAQQLSQALRQGQRLSQALSSLAEYFPPLYVGVVHAAETTSDLPAALSRYVDLEQRLSIVRARAVSAAIYPAILLVVGSAVTFFLLGYVVPRFANVYQDTGRPMSALTSLLLTWGTFLSTHAGLLLLMTATVGTGGILGWRLMYKRYGIAYLLSRIPGISLHVRHFELSRLYMTLGLLLSGGIPLTRALKMIETTVGAKAQVALQRVADHVGAGKPFSSAMETEHLTTAVAMRLFRVGERSGNLGDMLLKAARFYDAEISRFIDQFTKAAEPLLMTAIGVVVGTIVVLLYMPIFELAGSLQ